jgi:hypothetical protein
VQALPLMEQMLQQQVVFSVNSRLKLEDNRITTQTTNDDIDLDPSGTGLVNLVTTAQGTVGAAGAASGSTSNTNNIFPNQS